MREGPIDPAHAAEARTLAEELWRPDVARLELSHVLREVGEYELSHTLDLSRRLIAWFNQRPGLTVTDLETGRTLFTDAAVRDPWPVPVRGGFFIFDRARGLMRRLALGLGEARLDETSVPAVGDQDGVEASPTGELVALTLGHRRLQQWHWEDESPRPVATQTIARWPSLEPLTTIPGYDNQFDWESQVAVSNGAPLVLRPFDGGPPRTVEIRPSHRMTVLGRGLLADWLTLAVVDVGGGQRIELVPGRSRRGSTSVLDGFVSLSSDGRGLRVVTNGHAVRFDHEEGRVVRASRDPATLIGPPGSTRTGAWHPHVDVLANDSVCTLDGPIGELPASTRPIAWILDGEGLLLARHVGDRTRFEVWRVRR